MQGFRARWRRLRWPWKQSQGVKSPHGPVQETLAAEFHHLHAKKESL